MRGEIVAEIAVAQVDRILKVNAVVAEVQKAR